MTHASRPSFARPVTSSVMRVVPAVFALALAAMVALTPRAARAGTLQVRDEAHLLSTDDVGRLRATVGAAPFDARVVVTDAYADSEELGRFVGSLVTEPNAVVVGLDPTHRHVQVRFGTGARIPRASWPSIERAGNAEFRDRRWEAGLAAILDSASQSVDARAPEATPRRASGGASSFGLLGVLLVGGLVVAAIALFARSRSRGGDGYGGYGGIGPTGPYAGGPPGPYPGSGYGPGVLPPGAGGMGAVGGGLLGAGLGGLAGYELGRMEGEREERLRDEELAREERNANANSGGDDFDAGGGGSSWDDGGTDPGDAGGGGGDDGGGGGSDF